MSIYDAVRAITRWWEREPDGDFDAAVEGALETAWGRAAWNERDYVDMGKADWFAAPKKGNWVASGPRIARMAPRSDE